VLEQVRQKHHGFLLANGFVEDLKVEVPQHHARRQRRDGFPIEVILQNRCLPAGCPRPAAVWALAQSAFVEEDDRAAFLGFFLMAGQVFRFHSPMASSVRSNARPAGRCGLQFSCRNSFQTCPA